MSFIAIGAGLGAASAGYKLYSGIKQVGQANKINPVYTPYTASNAVKQQLGTVQNAYQGRMAGAASASDRILQSQANTLANASRGATDASQLLALGASTEGTADQASVDLAAREGQNKTGILDNLQNAYNKMTEDERQVYQSKLQKYQMDTQAKQALGQAGMGNIAGGIGDLGGLAIQGAQLKGLGAGGGMNQIGGYNLGQQSLVSSMPSGLSTQNLGSGIGGTLQGRGMTDYNSIMGLRG